jgi:hypothetical protein
MANRIRPILGLVPFVGLLLAASCGDDGPDSGADAVLHAPDLDAWLAAVANQSDSDDEAPVVYSSTLIEQAYRAGDINQDEYYTLRIAAVYDHANLDERFRAEPEPNPSASWLTSTTLFPRPPRPSFAPTRCLSRIRRATRTTPRGPRSPMQPQTGSGPCWER